MKHNVAIMLELTVVMLSASAFSSVQGVPDNQETIINRVIITPGEIRTAEVNGNFNIILTPEFSDRIVVTGSAKNVSEVNTIIRHHRIIMKTKDSAETSKVTIFISAKRLKDLRINGNAVVRCSEMLKTPALWIYLNGESNVNVRSSGRIAVDVAQDYELSAPTGRN